MNLDSINIRDVNDENDNNFKEFIKSVMDFITSEFINWIPTIPDKDTSNKRKLLRKKLTLEYGYLTFILSMGFVLLLPFWNKIQEKIIVRFYRMIISRFLLIFRRSSGNSVTLNFSVIKIIVFWSIILIILSITDLHSDFQILAARLGRVATYCLPTVLFLTLRPSPLPNTLYLSLLPIHKWLSRLIIFQSLLHTVMYIYFFMKRKTLSKIYRIDNLNGCIAMTAFLIIIITSLPIFRRSIYNFFYINHYICTWIVVITLYFHVRPGIPYLTLLNAAILIYQIYYRFKLSKLTKIDVSQISENLILVTLPNDSIANKSNLPGCHLRMIEYDENNYFKLLWKLLFSPIQHPFTISTLPIDKNQRLVVRKGKFDLNPNKKYFITGAFLPYLNFLKSNSYSSISDFVFNSNNRYDYNVTTTNNANDTENILNSRSFKVSCKKCLIVVGGSAISFALPILRILNYNGCTVKIIWVIRDHEDLKILDYYKNILINDDSIDIFITGKYSRSETINFKTALRELSRRRNQTQAYDEATILKAKPSGYQSSNLGPETAELITDDNEIDFTDMFKQSTGNSHQKETYKNTGSSTSSSESSPSSSPKNKSNETTALTSKSNNNPTNHNINGNYGSTSNTFNSNANDSEGHENFSPEIYFNSDGVRNHKSHISLRHNARNEKYSFADENRFENVDVDLGRSNGKSFPKRLAGRSSVVSFFMRNKKNDGNNNSSNNITNNFGLKRSGSRSTPNIGNISGLLSPKRQNDTSILAFNNKLDQFNKDQNVFHQSSIFEAGINDQNKYTPSEVGFNCGSSGLYDDLSDYWILQGLSCRIEFGRPKLGLHYYNWCIGSTCIGPMVDLNSGQAICTNEVPTKEGTKVWPLFSTKRRTQLDETQRELFGNSVFQENRKNRLAKKGGALDDDVWVIGAGPIGLVDNVRLWAHHCGFHFHAESFSI